jgi:peptide/nickel transport system substrate-binding protein
VVFRNDLSPEQALDLVCTGEGEVDIVTEVAPADAGRVEGSEHARLIAVDAMRAVAGVINRDADGLPLRDRRARRALNLAVDRERLVREAMFGRARPLNGLTPPTLLTALHRFPDRLAAYPHDADCAAELWGATGGTGVRPLRIAAPDRLERVAHRTAADLREALGVEVEVTLYGREEMREARRRLAEKTVPREWDLLLLEQTTQTADAPTLELHRAFVGVSGEYRAGPAVPEFEALWAELKRQTSLVK